MKTIGLVGGTSWVSSLEYYRFINQGVNEVLGGNQFARCVLYSINFGDITACNERNDTEGVYTLIRDAAAAVARAGAEGIVICANTLHQFADRVKKDIDLPLIHIAEATAREINRSGLSTVGLLGTIPTMEGDFYTAVLSDRDIRTLVPGPEEREFINKVIYEELVREIFKESSRHRFMEIMERLQRRGAEGIIMGCTEIPLIIQDEDSELPLFNTTAIHARAAVEFSLGKG
jgi:aspartate racemase